MTIEATKINLYAAINESDGLTVSKVNVYAVIVEIEPQERSFSTRQEGDVYVFQTLDDGNINVEFGVVQMIGGIENYVYLALFGGNENNEFWGNGLETLETRKLISETQKILVGLPATTSNLLSVEDAVNTDLEEMVSSGIASSIEVFATIPALNRVQIDITIEAEGESINLTFEENWSFTS